MDKIKSLIIVISLFLLMGASCEQSSTRSSSGREFDYSGTEGLNIEFIDGMPPENVWRDMSFDVGVDVQNKGLVNIEEGKVCLGGLSSNLFTNAGSCQSLVSEDGPLMGRFDYPDGEIRSYFWRDYKLTDEYKSYGEDEVHPLVVKVCYKEETRVGANACVKNVVRGMESLCEPGQLDLKGSSQGAPIAVTSIYEEVIPREGGVDLRFTIDISNVGDGEVIDLDQFDKKENCNFETTEKNKVDIKVALAGYPELDCRKNFVKLGQGGDGTILCKGNVDIAEGESFPLPLNIKLNYGYLSTESGGFTIKKDIYEEA